MNGVASDIMTRSVFVLSGEMSADEATDALRARGISGAPVCDAHDRLVGVVSKGDLAELRLGESSKTGACVADAMSTDVLVFRPEEPIETIARTMVFEGVHRAVIVDEDEHVLGILTPLDVLRAIVEAGPLKIEPPPRRTSRFPSWPADR